MPRVFDTVEEIWSWPDVETAATKADDESAARFTRALASYLEEVDPEAVELLPSARFGLTRLLQQHLSGRRSVLVPRFNCTAVQEAIEAAGGKVRPYDFAPSPGLFDWSAIKRQIDSSTGALIVTHYFGVPVDFRELREICRQNKIILIEDSAHTLGGRIGSEVAGTIGDAGLFSFNYDKPVSLGWGGAMVINNPDYRLDRSSSGISTPSVDKEITLLGDFLESMTRRRLLIPRRNSIFSRVLGRLGLRKNPSFRIQPDLGIGGIQAELGIHCLSRHQSVLQSRIKNAEILASHFPGRTWPVGADISPAWLKQKIRFSGIPELQKVAKKLQSKGFRAGNFNWPVLLGEQRDASGNASVEAAQLWMDMPVHQNLDECSMEILISLIEDLEKDA